MRGFIVVTKNKSKKEIVNEMPKVLKEIAPKDITIDQSLKDISLGQI